MRVAPDPRPVAHLADAVAHHAAVQPDEPAVVDVRESGTRVVSWQALAERSDRVAAALIEVGVAAGEPVAYQVPNWAEFAEISLATMRIGAVCMPLMPIFRERELEFALRHGKARVLIVPHRFRGRDHVEMAQGLRSRVPALEHVVAVGGPQHSHVHPYERLVERAAPDESALGDRRPAPDAIAQLLFTSGTSGEPKGVLHRHDALTLAAGVHIRHFELTENDVVYIPSPLAHQTGFLYGMWVALLLGVPQVVQDIWDARVGLRAMREHGATFVQAATPFLADLVDEVRETGNVPGSLRTFVATGAAVPRGLARQARSALGASVGGAWGTTESCMGTAFAPEDFEDRASETDGRALGGTELRVVDDHGRPLPCGTEGNLEVRSDSLFAGYLDRPELTAASLTTDGFYRTGDLAVLGRDGYVRIVGRVRDNVNRGGEKVPVAEIEQLLYAHSAVRDVAIVAMPDRRLGERACAFIVPAPGASPDLEGVRRYLDERKVAKHYWPERVELLEDMPRTPSGKVQKYRLRERARAFHEREFGEKTR